MTEQMLLDLLHSMTLEEKAAQLTQVDIYAFDQQSGSLTGIAQEQPLSREQLASVGSLICGGMIKPSVVRDAMLNMKKDAAHDIPPLIMSDVIHGMRTIFPIPLGLACSFDESLVEHMAGISAAEASASGIHVTFAPMADVVRDPRWGRCMESFGESSELCGEMSAAIVRGFHKGGMATCAKHFAGYGAVNAGRDYAQTDISRTELYNVYLPPFEAALKAGCDMVMPAFTPIDRVPAAANSFLMTEILRKRWGWDGVTISDWDSVHELVVHGMCRDLADASAAAMNAGLDMDMIATAYIRELKKLVEQGIVSEERVDAAVLRVLRLKNKLGLFETDLNSLCDGAQTSAYLREEHKAAALEAAIKSCVLLKNEGVLPLKPGCKVALAGPYVYTHELRGAWSAGGLDADTLSIAEALAGSDAIVLTDAQDADVILYVCGEPQNETGEAQSKVYPIISDEQVQEMAELRQLGKPLAAVLLCGRGMIITPMLPHCDAVLNAWFPGTCGAEAILRLLTGQANPSGHLSVTMPRALGQTPVFHDMLSTGRPAERERQMFKSCYIDETNAPLFPFGFGLSYTSFCVKDFKAVWQEDEQKLLCSAVISNAGRHDGETVIQLYHRRYYAAQIMPEKKLTAWQRMHLKAGESKRIELVVPAEKLLYWDAAGQPLPIAGTYVLMLGENSEDVQMAEIHLK